MVRKSGINFGEIGFPILHDLSIGIGTHNLTDIEAVCRQRDSLDKPAFERYRALFDHRGGLQQTIEYFEYL